MTYTPLQGNVIARLKQNGATFIQENQPHELDKAGYRNLFTLSNGTLLSLIKTRFSLASGDSWEVWSETTDGTVAHYRSLNDNEILGFI